MNKEQIPVSGPLKVDLVPLSAEHLQSIMVIEKACFSEPWSKEDFQKLVDDPRAICLAALYNDRVVGYSCAWIVIETAELGNLAVAPEYQRLSVGRRLLEETIRLCASRRAGAVFLEVRRSNSRAISLYEGYGFRKIGVRRRYYSNPVEDALVLKLGL
jgi:ribosomal-protein-alanine N-acetyltransferase